MTPVGGQFEDVVLGQDAVPVAGNQLHWPSPTTGGGPSPGGPLASTAVRAAGVGRAAAGAAVVRNARAAAVRPHHPRRPGTSGTSRAFEPGTNQRAFVTKAGQKAEAGSMDMKLYQPVLFVGLGGTGCRIGVEFEKRLRDAICGPDGRAFAARRGRGGMRPTSYPTASSSCTWTERGRARAPAGRRSTGPPAREGGTAHGPVRHRADAGLRQLSAARDEPADEGERRHQGLAAAQDRGRAAGRPAAARSGTVPHDRPGRALRHAAQRGRPDHPAA